MKCIETEAAMDRIMRQLQTCRNCGRKTLQPDHICRVCVPLGAEAGLRAPGDAARALRVDGEARRMEGQR